MRCTLAASRPGERLVEQQHRRRMHQRPCQGDALALPARQRRDRLLRKAVRLHPSTHRAPRRSRLEPVDARRELDVLATAQLAVAMRVMRDPADVAARLLPRAAVRCVHDRTSRRLERRADDGDQRALAGPVRALNKRDGAGSEVDVDGTQRDAGAEQARHAVHLDARDAEPRCGDLHCPVAADRVRSCSCRSTREPKRNVERFRRVPAARSRKRPRELYISDRFSALREGTTTRVARVPSARLPGRSRGDARARARRRLLRDFCRGAQTGSSSHPGGAEHLRGYPSALRQTLR